MARTITRAGIALLLVAIAGSAHADTIYSNGFEDGLAPGFSSSLISVTPIGDRHYLGQFANESITLTLNDLEPGLHRVEFDFYGIGTWDGNQLPGPDWFVLLLNDEIELMRTTFAIGSEDTRVGTQLYPGTGADTNLASNPGRTEAIENDTLGYLYMGIYPRDAVWHLAADFMVDGTSAQLTFRGEGLQGIRDESWGLDNMSVSPVVPAPGVAGVLVGAAALAGRRRR